MTVKEFCEKYRITITATLSNIETEDKSPVWFRWDCVLRYKGREMKVKYGYAHGHLRMKTSSGWGRLPYGLNIGADSKGNLYTSRPRMGHYDLRQIPGKKDDGSILFETSLDYKRTLIKAPAPDVESVLWCTVTDSEVLFNRMTFEDFCSDYGYDSDSRKTYKMYKACLEQGQKLNKLLGESLINELQQCEPL